MYCWLQDIQLIDLTEVETYTIHETFMCLCLCFLGAEAWRRSGSGLPLRPAAFEESQVPGQKDHWVSHDGECFIQNLLLTIYNLATVPLQPSFYSYSLMVK